MRNLLLAFLSSFINEKMKPRGEIATFLSFSFIVVANKDAWMILIIRYILYNIYLSLILFFLSFFDE
jgi:hypothetical protein